jgi:UDP-N-acetylmuramate dehydrogenase
MNPPGDHAARLIDTAGLKGHRIGDAEVSSKHANFILNRGEATAADLENLVRHVQTEVARVHGVQLTPEVRIVGQSRADHGATGAGAPRHGGAAGSTPGGRG